MVRFNVRKTATASALVLLVVASCSSVGGETAEQNRTADRATVIDVVDGDTVRLRIDGHQESVRLIGIDTPETKHPTKGVQCFGPQASDFMTRLLPAGTELRIERDVEARDSYDRLLLYLFAATPDGERFINLELVTRGYARPLSIEPNVRYRRLFVDAAIDAERNLRGLWRVCK